MNGNPHPDAFDGGDYYISTDQHVHGTRRDIRIYLGDLTTMIDLTSPFKSGEKFKFRKATSGKYII